MKAAFSSGFSKGPGPLEKGITLRPALFRTQSVQKNTLSAQSVFHDVHAAVKNDPIVSRLYPKGTYSASLHGAGANSARHPKSFTIRRQYYVQKAPIRSRGDPFS